MKIVVEEEEKGDYREPQLMPALLLFMAKYSDSRELRDVLGPAKISDSDFATFKSLLDDLRIDRSKDMTLRDTMTRIG